MLDESSVDAVTLRMSFANALIGAAKFNAFIFLFVSLPDLVLGRGVNNLDNIFVFFVVFTTVVGIGFRELTKVSLSPAGIGSRSSPIEWSKINEVERKRWGFGSGISWTIYWTYRDEWILGSIVRTPEFQETLDRFAPAESQIRVMLASAER